MGLISDNDERAYLEEIKHLENWCQENNLLLNVNKTKELIVDCSKKQERHYQPVRISGTTVERVDSFRLQTALQGTAELLHRTIKSILTGNITVWFGNSTKQDRQTLQRVVRSAERITHTELADLQTIYYKRCQTKARRIVKDPTRPSNRLFTLLSTGAPQGCVLSPLLYSLYTYDCTATSSSTIIVKFAYDTVVMGLISDNDERAYLEEIKHLENWCQENNLLLNVNKTKELIVDCSKKQERHYQPVRISGTTVERVDSFRYLGVHIPQDLSWSRHTNSLAKKARQCLYHLRRLRDFRLPSKVLRNFYTCTIKSILTGNITVWFGNSTKQDRQTLQRVVRSAERITHTELADLQTIYYKRCQTKARRIVKDPTRPSNRLFTLLSTGAPQGCVLSPLLYSLYTYDCTATSSSTIIVKFAYDTVVMGLISDNDERAYLEEIKHLENWCQENNLLLNVNKTKELIVDCSKKQERHYQPVRISGTTVERVDSFRYLGVHIPQDLSWSRHTNSLAKKARQCLYHLRRLRDFRLPSKVLRNFYTCTIKSILTGNITVWFGNSTKQDRQTLQRVVRSAERITHTELADLQTIYYKRCQTKARRIVKDPTRPSNRLFTLLSTGAPQGCVLSPLLYSLYTYDCTATSSSTIIVKFAYDTVVMGLISDNDERAYLEEIKHLENWCQENNLLLNVNKTKELIVDCSKKQERHYQPVRISGTTVERVDSFRYLGVHIPQDLSWSRHTNSLAKKARQCLYHLRRLRDFRLPSKVLRNFYTCTIKSILTGNITVWFGNSTKQDRQTLQRVVRSAERITHTELADLQTIYYKRCQTKARRIVKDPTRPSNRLFTLL
ncbi:hypothetical protein P4O66_003688, partial [Electrophorus voltai]